MDVNILTKLKDSSEWLRTNEMTITAATIDLAICEITTLREMLTDLATENNRLKGRLLQQGLLNPDDAP